MATSSARLDLSNQTAPVSVSKFKRISNKQQKPFSEYCFELKLYTVENSKIGATALPPPQIWEEERASPHVELSGTSSYEVQRQREMWTQEKRVARPLWNSFQGQGKKEQVVRKEVVAGLSRRRGRRGLLGKEESVASPSGRRGEERNGPEARPALREKEKRGTKLSWMIRPGQGEAIPETELWSPWSQVNKPHPNAVKVLPPVPLHYLEKVRVCL